VDQFHKNGAARTGGMYAREWEGTGGSGGVVIGTEAIPTAWRDNLFTRSEERSQNAR